MSERLQKLLNTFDGSLPPRERTIPALVLMRNLRPRCEKSRSSWLYVHRTKQVKDPGRTDARSRRRTDPSRAR